MTRRLPPVRLLPAALLAVALTAALAVAGTPPASAATGDIGYEDFVYSPLGGSPTGSKPESKLWFNNGWWGILWSPSAAEYRIAKLDRSTGTWSPTAAAADNRTASRADTLWVPDTNKLYVASHYFVNAGHSTTVPAPGNGARLYRFSYNAASDSYTLDPGYPAALNNYKTETLVIDRDSTGTLWASWTYGSRPYVAHTLNGNDASWSVPYVVPGAGTTLDPDDISSLVRFGGNKIGVMWSNQVAQRFYFAVHGDGGGDGAGAWQVEEVPLSGITADDHINLKADATGRVYAAVKTSEGSSARPLIMLLVRAADGTWTNTTFGTVSNSQTRPIVLLDEEHQTIHMYATGPQPPKTSGQSGGDIVEKTTSMASPSFAPGAATPVIRNAGSPDMNDATSTKQNVSGTTGIVVLANDATANDYWHLQESLGGSGSTVAASFSATPTSGTAPLSVQFTDTSTGGPTAWSWDFGDGSPASSEQNPAHVYTEAGTYTVSLTASNASGSDVATKTAYIVVSSPGGGGTAATFLPTADAYVQSGAPAKNYGTATSLRVRSSGPSYRSYLTFDVSGLAGAVTSAKLRMFVTDASPDGGHVHAVSPAAWTEGGITFNNAPSLATAEIGRLGSVATGTWAEVDVTQAVTGNGAVSFGIDSLSTNSAIFDSREGATPPQLVVTTGSGGGQAPVPTASFSGTPTSGTAPLTVQFTDTSTGSPTGWSWDFGDGSPTSSEQNPSHVYTTPGTYTVTLTASNDSGPGTPAVATDYIVVTSPSGGSATTTFNPIADAYVQDGSPTKNYGAATTLRVRSGAPSYRSYLTFDVRGLIGTVTSAKLRLWVTDASPDGGHVHVVSAAGWTEAGITFATAPSLAAPAIAGFGSVLLDAWGEADVTSAVAGNGTVSFGIDSASTNSAIASSREGGNPPQLVVTTQ